MGEVEILNRAHQLFAGAVSTATFGPAIEQDARLPMPGTASYRGTAADGYRRTAQTGRDNLAAATRTDAALATVIAAARQDHATGRELTRKVLEAARADTGAPADSPVAQREAVRRRADRLRAQHEHVSAARRKALRRRALLRALRYLALGRGARSGRLRLRPPHSRAGLAVRAALSRLGRPYVWGATGPDQFDCSGLVQWSYRQAGIQLDRTTYDQINDGIPVPRSQVQPGDLVFPHAGHVQMAIGNGLVVEAPYSGATVRISRLGDNIAIRRPVA